MLPGTADTMVTKDKYTRCTLTFTTWHCNNILKLYALLQPSTALTIAEIDTQTTVQQVPPGSADTAWIASTKDTPVACIINLI